MWKLTVFDDLPESMPSTLYIEDREKAMRVHKTFVIEGFVSRYDEVKM